MNRLAFAVLYSGIALTLSGLALPARAQQVEVLHQFTGGADGWMAGGVMMTRQGNLFGATGAGGTGTCLAPGVGCGTLYRVTTDGNFTTIHSFVGTDGEGPSLPAEGKAGFLYGTTFNGGDNGYGVIYRISQKGIFKKLRSFTGMADGGFSRAPLTLGSDGNFYGSTTSGGASGCGTIFRFNPTGGFSTLASLGCGYASGPASALTEGPDGDFYGTLGYGGNGSCDGGCGAVFKVTPQGVLTVLDVFDDETNGANAASLSLANGSDGNYYGMTSGDGTGGDAGTAFRMAPDGSLTTLYYFTGSPYMNPISSFIPASPNAFYGATAFGGDYFTGALIEMTTAGTVTTAVSFASDTWGPSGPMVIGKDGKLYFANGSSGGLGYGVVARVTLPAQ